jgi:hypothetical protein
MDFFKGIKVKKKVKWQFIRQCTARGRDIQRTVGKCELIVTHTASRSGITYMYIAGINPVDIMKISGHKTEKQLLEYIKTRMDATAEKLSVHEYFSPLKKLE